MFKGGRKKGPHENLFVTNKYGGVLIVNADCSAGKELQWHAVIAERLPHCDRNGNAFLIDRGVFLSTGNQDIQVPILCEKIFQSCRSVDTSSEKDRAVLRCDRG